MPTSDRLFVWLVSMLLDFNLLLCMNHQQVKVGKIYKCYTSWLNFLGHFFWGGGRYTCARDSSWWEAVFVIIINNGKDHEPPPVKVSHPPKFNSVFAPEQWMLGRRGFQLSSGGPGFCSFSGASACWWTVGMSQFFGGRRACFSLIFIARIQGATLVVLDGNGIVLITKHTRFWEGWWIGEEKSSAMISYLVFFFFVGRANTLKTLPASMGRFSVFTDPWRVDFLWFFFIFFMLVNIPIPWIRWDPRKEFNDQNLRCSTPNCWNWRVWIRYPQVPGFSKRNHHVFFWSTMKPLSVGMIFWGMTFFEFHISLQLQKKKDHVGSTLSWCCDGSLVVSDFGIFLPKRKTSGCKTSTHQMFVKYMKWKFSIVKWLNAWESFIFSQCTWSLPNRKPVIWASATSHLRIEPPQVAH